MTHAPDLHTARLHLRAHRLDDAAALHRMWSDPAVVRHLGGEPSRVDESWARLLRYAGMWPLLGFGYWAVTDRDTSIYLGDCGFLLGKRALAPAYADVPEAGWALVPEAQGRGIATEALSAAHAWADERGLGETMCLIDPDNGPSLRVAHKLGYTVVDQRRLGEATVSVHRRDALAARNELQYGPP
jgi:RimJ/RimL family protein N-acetyltransferase